MLSSVFEQNFIFYQKNLENIMENNVKTPFSDHFMLFFQNIIIYSYSRFMKLYEVKDSIDIYSKIKEISIKISDIKADSALKEFLDEMLQIFIPEISYEKVKDIENRSFILLLFSEFENYIFKCFKSIYFSHLYLLKEKNIPLSLILEKNNAELENVNGKVLFLEILNNIVELQIRDSFYQSYEDIFKIANKKLGIKHNISKDSIDILSGYKLIRNLYAHGDGTVNQIFLEQIKRYDLGLSSLTIGKKLELDSLLLLRILTIIFKICKEFDKAYLNAI